MEKRNCAFVLAMVIILMAALPGCKKKDNEPETPAETETILEEKSYLSVETGITYSAGNDGNWSYVNQRKEFPNNESCYVRVASVAITDGFWNKGVGDEVTVTYRFTGVENCMIEVSEGRVTSVDTDDSNVAEFTKTISAEKEKNAKEDIVIFRYLPNGAEKVTLEVIYDDQIAEKYDALNSVYFES